MKPRLDAWTVVVQGAWNVRLFSPPWVAKNLFDSKPVNIEVPVGPPMANLLRYTSERVSLIPSDDCLIFGVLSADVASMQAAEAVAKRAVMLLSHTPLAGVGINIGYDEGTASPWVSRLFDMPDLDGLSRAGCKVKRSNLIRAIERDGVVINITLALDNENGRAEVFLNFHHDVQSSGVAAERLDGTAQKCIVNARALLREAYGATLEEDDDVNGAKRDGGSSGFSSLGPTRTQESLPITAPEPTGSRRARHSSPTRRSPCARSGDRPSRFRMTLPARRHA